MESIYAALILHKAGKDVSEKGITDILKAAGANADANQIKALVKALGSMDIDEVIKNAAAAPVAAAPAAAGDKPEKKAAKKKEKPKEEAKKEEPTGLGALFG
ncbi:MAG: 50S ribosomal protein P1 [Promethearchaeota archaeon]